MQSVEEEFERAKAILGEHFQHFAVVVQYEDGSVWHEGNNALVEKALYEEALYIIKEEREAEDIVWEVDWDDEEEEDSWLEDEDE